MNSSFPQGLCGWKNSNHTKSCSYQNSCAPFNIIYFEFLQGEAFWCPPSFVYPYQLSLFRFITSGVSRYDLYYRENHSPEVVSSSCSLPVIVYPSKAMWDSVLSFIVMCIHQKSSIMFFEITCLVQNSAGIIHFEQHIPIESYFNTNHLCINLYIYGGYCENM